LPVATIGPFVSARMTQLNSQLMRQFYKESQDTGLVVEHSPRSDSVCCFTRISDAGARGLGVGSLGLENLASELVLQSAMSTTVERRDSSRPNAGSHIYVPWSAVASLGVLPELDSSGYYKLFLQYCYRGVRVGAVHEFNTGNTCRWCGFNMPAELVAISPADIADMGGRRARLLDALAAERETIALDALRRQNIGFDETAFRALEAAMKNNKAIVVAAPLVTDDFLTVLAALGRTLGILGGSATDDWGVFVAAMTTIAQKGVVDTERLDELVPFSRIYDNALQNLLRQITAGLGLKGCDRLLKRVGRSMGIDMSYRGADATFTAANDLLTRMFDLISVNEDSTTVLRNYIDIFVKTGSQIRYNYVIDAPNATKWFPKISRNHKSLLDTIWGKSFGTVSFATHALSEYSDETIDIIQASLDRYTVWFGNWLAVLRSDVRAGVQVTPKEFRLMVQWSLFTGLTSLFSETSPFYADATDSVKKVEANKFHIMWVCEALIVSINQVYKYQKTSAEISAAVEARAELERAYFIQKFDKLEKDEKDIEKRKKALKLGDYSVGTIKNLFSYDADFFEFERGQRAAMGLPEFAGDITGQAEVEAAVAAVAEEGYDHRAPADEDVD